MNSEKEVLAAPVFVVGPLRSGTTMLRLIIDNHSKTNFFGEFEASVSQANGDMWPSVSDFISFLEHDRQTREYNFHFDDTLSYEELVHSMLKQIYDRKPASVIGASVHSRIDLLPKLWKDAKFIHLLRDPRDVARSCIGMGWVGHVFFGVDYWTKVEKDWSKLEQVTDKSNRLNVRYETLVKQPEVEAKRICDFIGVDFEPEMLDISRISTYSKPDAKYSEQWRKKLSAQELSWVEAKCKELMQERGYELSQSQPKMPGPIQIFMLKVQNRLFRVKFNVNNWGFRLWLTYVMSKLLGLTSVKNAALLKINEIDKERLK